MSSGRFKRIRSFSAGGWMIEPASLPQARALASRRLELRYQIGCYPRVIPNLNKAQGWALDHLRFEDLTSRPWNNPGEVPRLS